ncbi:MAG: lysophospholipid acyltransferase family protein [Planctomycetota bacterium]|nr:lysophospholipid acyltransferase family protein [Planctomycetota bacterium]MDA1263430.1 lysophospholipid acyltransferase family protein [Planctomycetota bacterium]
MNHWGLFAKSMYEALRIVTWTQINIIDEGGRNQLDGQTATLIAANHQSHADTALIFNTVPKSVRSRLRIVASKVRFQTAASTATRRERFERWFMHGLAVNAYRAILVGGDIGPLRSIEGIADALANGETVVLYPEGTRSCNGTLSALRPGVAMLAIASRCNVIPVRIEGTGEALPRARYFPRFRNRITIRFRQALVAQQGESEQAFLVRLTEQLQPFSAENQGKTT